MLVNPSPGYGAGFSYRDILRITILSTSDEQGLCTRSHTRNLKYNLCY